MRSDAGHVGGYLALAPGGRRAVLSEMRHTSRRLLAGFAESMTHGMPAHSRDGAAEAARATHKRHISLHVMRADAHDTHRSQLAGLDLGEGMHPVPQPGRGPLHRCPADGLPPIAASRGPVR